MRKLNLPDVTIVALDCVAHALTRLAIEDTLAVIEPGAVLVWTDRKLAAPTPDSMVPADLRSLYDVAKALWYEVPRRVSTSHFLLVQWDGWAVDPYQWDSRWLDYDYVGAPWWYTDNKNVGNGGFSLRSTDLMRFVASHEVKFSLSSNRNEDDLLCRGYRPLLECYAYNWCPEDLARGFSYERVATPRRTFGFHGSFNWPRHLSSEQLYNRISIAAGIPYIQSKPDFSAHQLMLRSAS